MSFTTSQGALFSSNDQTWRTPRWLFEELNIEFNFDLDAAASNQNHLCASYLTEEQDALSLHWPGSVIWCNPPYGKGVGLFVQKAHEEALKGKTICLLIFARTDTRWWHDHCMKAHEIRFIKARLRFSLGGISQANLAPAPSCFVIFRGVPTGNPPVISSWLQPRHR